MTDNLVRTATTVTRNSWRYQAQLELELCDDLPPVSGHPQAFGQVLINLIVNAEQALAGRSGEILVELRSEGDAVVVRVSDKGPGWGVQPPELAFQAFFSTGDRWDGAGLGLWASRAIVAEHGGTITLDSPGEGTSIAIRLPKAQ